VCLYSFSVQISCKGVTEKGGGGGGWVRGYRSTVLRGECCRRSRRGKINTNKKICAQQIFNFWANLRKIKQVIVNNLSFVISVMGRPQWPRRLKRRSVAARPLSLWVRIRPWSWMSVCFECCVLSSRGLCVELIPRPEEPYRLWCIVVCDREISWMRKPWPTGGVCRTK
jgi:hypothetical protein